MGTDEFIRVGDAARLLAFFFGQRFASTGRAHLATARDRLLDAAKAGEFPIVAGPQVWPGAGSFPLPSECVSGLTVDNIDWDESVFDASADVPMEATASIQQLHAAPAILWVPMEGFAGSFGIDEGTVGRWNRR
jgi:hypothetical protein